MGGQGEDVTLGVGHNIALPAFDLFACIIASWPAAFGGLYALAVDNTGCRAFSASHDTAIRLQKSLHHVRVKVSTDA